MNAFFWHIIQNFEFSNVPKKPIFLSSVFIKILSSIILPNIKTPKMPTTPPPPPPSSIIPLTWGEGGLLVYLGLARKSSFLITSPFWLVFPGGSSFTYDPFHRKERDLIHNCPSALWDGDPTSWTEYGICRNLADLTTPWKIQQYHRKRRTRSICENFNWLATNHTGQQRTGNQLQRNVFLCWLGNRAYRQTVKGSIGFSLHVKWSCCQPNQPFNYFFDSVL